MLDLPGHPTLDKLGLIGACSRLALRVNAERLLAEVAALAEISWAGTGGRVGVHRAAQAIFLRGFLAVLAKEMPEASIETDIIDVPDPGEWIVLPEHDRIDISIRSIKAGLLVFIENKIDAGWQEDQLRRYRKRLELEKHTYPKGILVLISPKSVPAETGVPPISIYTTRIMSRLGLLQLSRPSNQSV